MTRPAKPILIVVCAALAALLPLAGPSGRAAAATWTLRQLPPSPPKEGPGPGTRAMLAGVSCPSDSLCVAVGALDTLAFSRAPTGGAAKWRVVNPPYPVGPGKTCLEGEPHCPTPGGRLEAVSCPSESLCVAVSREGFIYVSTDPTGGADAWSATVVNDGSGATHLSGVSCPSPAFCAAVSGSGSGNSGGKVLTSTSPAANTWQAVQLGGSLDLRGISCGAPSMCVAVAREGRIVVSTDPTGGASAWRDIGAPGGPGHLEGVDCPTSVFCAAGNTGGNILTSTNPAAGAASWSEVGTDRSVQITGVSCPTASRCAAVDNNGDVLTSTNPTGGSGAWSSENLVPFHHEYGQAPQNALFGVSCSSVSLCALVGSESRIFTATHPFAAPADPPRPRRRRRAPRRPRTHLFLSDSFWYVTRSRHRRVRAGFRFYSPTRVRGFECKRDQRRYRRCHSPQRYWVGHGRHVLRVRAIGPTGLRGPAAGKRFRVIWPAGRRH